MFTAVGILGASVPLLIVTSGLVGLSTTLGRNAFDGLLQRRAPEALLGRAGARYETRFQLAWVFGGVLATPISLPVEVSMTVLTAIYVPALAVFVRGVREAHRFEGPPEEHLGGAHARLAMAHQAWEARVAPRRDRRSVGRGRPRPERGGAGGGGRRALPVGRPAAAGDRRRTEVNERDVLDALQFAETLIRAASPR